MDVMVRACGVRQWQCIGHDGQGVTDAMAHPRLGQMCVSRGRMVDMSGWHTDVSWWEGEGMWMVEACGGLADFENFHPVFAFTCHLLLNANTDFKR